MVYDIRRHIDRLFDEFLGARLGTQEGMFLPTMDVRETDEEIVVEFELPGIDSDKVEIDLSNNILSVRGERRYDAEEQEGEFRRVERAMGRFERQVQLPTTIDENEVEAEYEDGVLCICIGKKKEAKQSGKRIPIKKVDGAKTASPKVRVESDDERARREREAEQEAEREE